MKEWIKLYFLKSPDSPLTKAIFLGEFGWHDPNVEPEKEDHIQLALDCRTRLAYSNNLKVVKVTPVDEITINVYISYSAIPDA